MLEDIVGATQGDQIAGCSVEDARIALRALAQIHGPVLGDLALGASDWLNLPNPLNQALLTQLLPLFLERYGDRIDPAHAEVCQRFVVCADAWWADQRPPLGLVHGDYRLDNLLFGDGTCKVVDWQTVAWGASTIDLSYFIGGGLVVEDRRAHEQELVGLYHDTLLEQGVEGFSRERCWEDYRRMTFQALVMAIAASMVVQRTERGDDMFMTNLARAAQQIIDLDALELLPEAAAGKPPPLQPKPEDEGTHSPGPEPMWNESWYFDAVSDDGELGLYTRLGRVPNQDSCLHTTCICGPGRPSIMLVDGSAPLPPLDDPAQVVDIAGLHAEHICEEPLKRYRIKLEGTAQAHADPSAPLRAEQGEPVEIALDLVWETDGVPYAWRQSTRYEIPCRVTGSVRIGDEQIEFAGPGQRDHSWGARDWWASDWMWSALHLTDGTHTHAVGVPQLPGFGVGYIQREGVVAEIESVNATEVVADNGLITAATIESGPLELHRRCRAGRLRRDPAGRARRPRLALPARDVQGAHQGRPLRQRLGRVEPQPARAGRVSTTASAGLELEQVDLFDMKWRADGPPHELFKRMRAEAPVHWNPLPDGSGCWSVTKHADIAAISRDTETFSSHRGGIFLHPDQVLPLDLNRNMLLYMDPPQHTRYRLILQKAFTPHSVAKMEDSIRARVTRDHRRGDRARLLRLRRRDRRADPARRADGADGRARGGHPEVLRLDRADRGLAAIARAERGARRVRRVRPLPVRADRAPDGGVGRGLAGDEAAQRRGRRPAADRSGDRDVLRAAGVRRQRHHAQLGGDRHARVARAPRAAAKALRRSLAGGERGRGDPALDLGGAVVQPHRHRRHRAGRPADQRGRPRRDVVRERLARRGRCSAIPTDSTSSAPSPITWPSAAAGGTSASAPGWRGWSCGSCSRRSRAG